MQIIGENYIILIMNNYDDFEMIELPANRGDSSLPAKDQVNKSQNVATSKIVSDNLPKIIDLASSIVEIEKMKVASEAVLAKMREDRLSLLAEAEAYAKKKNADTSDIVARFTLVRDMMRDFYAANTGSMTSEDFQKVISSIIEQMGKK